MDKRHAPLSPFEQLQRRVDVLTRIENSPGISVAETIRLLRKELLITLPEMSRLTGISTRALHDIESGQGNPTLSTIDKLLSPFGLEISVCRRQK